MGEGPGIPAPSSADAFLSSPSGMRDSDGGPDKNGVRYKAWESVSPGRLFVAECDWDGFKPGARIPELTVATALMSQIRSSKRFICLLTSRSSGSLVRIAETPLSSTFFELEIFQSIVLDKSTYLLVHESFDPAQIEQYLDLLKFAFPDWRGHASMRLNDLQVIHAIGDIVRGRSASTQWQVQRRRGHAADFHHALMRSRDRFVRCESKPTVHFLNLGQQKPVGSQCDVNAIESLLKKREHHIAEPDVDNDQRLAISWLLIRELNSAPLLNETGEIVQLDPFLLSAWNLVLGDWHSAASWGALHSNIYIGTLPTLGTLEMVRNALRPSGDLLGSSTDFPGGGYATSYYSLSKMVPASERRAVLALARETLLMEAEDDAKNRPGCLALLGSIVLQEGNPIEAIELYEKALTIHTRSKNQKGMGELLCELSLARLQSGQWSKAAAEAERGIALMRDDGGSDSGKVDGPLIRAMFKSAYVQLRTLRPGGAFLYFEALKLAKEMGYTDQYTQWGPAGIGNKVLRGITSRFDGH